MADEKALSLPEAAARIGVTPAAIKYWILQGILKAEQVGGFWIIWPKDLEAANEQNQKNPRRGKRGPRPGRLVKGA